MKKFLTIIFILFIFCNLVKADCSSIMYLKNNNAVVINEKGATTYEYEEDSKIFKKTNFKIPYGAKVTLYADEAKIEDDYLVSVLYQEEYYTIKASDLKNSNEFKSENLKLEKTNYYTYEDTEVRSGPGIIYDVIGVIKADTNVYSTENIDTYSGISNVNEETGPWIYISDGNIGGFIYYDTCSGSLPIKIGELIKNSNNYYYMGNSDYGIGLRRYDKVNVKYVVYDSGHHQSYYIEYNGKNALINEELIAEKVENELIFLSLDSEDTALNDINNITDEKFNLFEDKALNKKSYLKTNNKYITKYYNRTFDGLDIYYVEINKKMYRIVYNTIVGEDDLVVYDKNKTYTIEYQGRKIQAYKLLNTFEDNDYYSSVSGIISIDVEEENENDEEENIINDNENNNTTNDEENSSENNNNNNESSNESQTEEVLTGISSKEYVLYCFIGCFILSVISEILIIVINKPKN